MTEDVGLIFPDDPFEAYLELPREVRMWFEKPLAVMQMQQGMTPDFLDFWESLTEAEQWMLVGDLIEQSAPLDRPCPKVVLKKRAAPLRTPSLNKEPDCVPVGNPSKLFDLTDLIKEEKRSLYPHVAWFCPSGWGKDYNSSKLISQADGEIIACLIKEPEIWQKHCPQARIVCNGYDVSDIEKVLVEVSDRNESRMINLEPKTPLTVVFSDYPSIVEGIEGITEKYVARILRDARSNKIRFWFLTHEQNIAALDMEGRSDLLRNITMVRGGDFALEHAKSLIKTGLLTKQDIQFFNGCDRPCIVGNTPALLG
jgi:hypothetical protein